MNVTEYTCGFMIDRSGTVALVEKLKPSWQAGKLNGIGGKIEEGETLFDGMRREWKEETGNDHADWDHLCSLIFPDARVNFFRAFVDVLPLLLEFNDSGERLHTCHVSRLPENLIPNLHWLIPLCLDEQGAIGAKLYEDTL